MNTLNGLLKPVFWCHVLFTVQYLYGFRPHYMHFIRCGLLLQSTDRVAWFVCLLVTFLSRAKTAEPIEMPFWGLTLVGPVNHILNGGQDRTSQLAARRGDKWAVQPFIKILVHDKSQPGQKCLWNIVSLGNRIPVWSMTQIYMTLI